MRKTVPLGVLTGLAVAAGPAAAVTTIHQDFSVTLTIVAECVIRSTATLAFGSLGVLGGPGGTATNDATTTVAVQCTDTTPYDIGLNEGTTSGGTTTTRLLAGSGSATVQYKLYTDTNHTINWGNTVGSDTSSQIGNGASQSYTIYGRIPAQTTPAPDSYSDTVRVTITY